MPSSLLATLAALTGESITSLYPIIIKRVDTDLLTQTAVRFAVYPILALLLGGFGSLAKTWGSAPQALAGFAFGMMNLLHVFSSYVAFDELQAGIAMSIFYLYPFLNLLGSRLFFGEAIHAWMMPFFAVALIGTYLIASVADKAKTYEHEGQPTRNITRGLVAAFIAALTESGIYLAVRGSVTSDPYANQLLLYLGGTAILAAALPALKAAGHSIDLRGAVLSKLTLFNSLIGFVGGSLMFWSARYLPAYAYSIIAFAGVAAAYGWGILFADETPHPTAITGAGLVLGAVGALRVLA
jgi:drug/metabolite transporter (DMT)-like permease